MLRFLLPNLAPLLAAAALAPFAGGCVAFYSHRDVTFRVADGEGGGPIPGALVGVSYEPHYLVLNKPRDRRAPTGPLGRVTLPVARWWVHAGPGFSFHAPGYLRHGEKAEPGERLPRGLMRCGDGPRCFTIPLYRGPDPRAVLVVGDAFSGVVAVDLLPSPRLSTGPPGRRRIELAVPASGYLAVEADPLLRRTGPLNYTARRADGRPLPRPSVERPSEHALRWVYSDGGRHLFVVGPASMEDDALRRIAEVVDQPNGGRTITHKRRKFHAFVDAMARGAAGIPGDVPREPQGEPPREPG